MLLSQLVKINQEALVANAVNFELMDDPEKNLRLCRGFVFNYDSDPKKLKNSTVGVLETLRRSFYSASEPNVHLMVQDYGKGKSHFALTIANFFQKPYNSPEVEGILQQIEYATSNNNQILQGLKYYKEQGRNLVICLSGDKPIADLKKQFLQALRKTLNYEEITDSIAEQVCKQPLQYLQNLNIEQRELAEAYLERIGNPEGDINKIIQCLREDSYQVITRVKEICREVTGITPYFDADIDVESILADLINKLCTGENRRFQGILIIFDELYNYLQKWATDPVAAGGTTLQNITNICERFKGKIALLSLTQRRPGRVFQSKNVEDYNRLVSRIELLPSTYEPVANLELVLDSLLAQQETSAAWQEFSGKWRDTLNSLSTNIYKNRTANYYQSRNWPPEKFLKHITLGCFPLHPLTSYLLCNLDFTQGRTSIQFVQEDVSRFIQEQPVDKSGNPNLIYPVALVDAFEGNFSNPDANREYSTVFSDYSYSANKVRASSDAEPDELLVLKALLLFYANGGRLTKSDKEKHEELLSVLTGLSILKLKVVLDKLNKTREVVYHNDADNTYRFYAGGFGIDELRRRIKEETGNKPPSIDRVENYCQSNISKHIGNDTIPTQFIELNGLRSEDWRYYNKVFTATRFRQALFSDKTLKDIDVSGIVVYIIAETSEELLALRSEIKQLLERSPIKSQVVIAISSQPVGELARLLLENSVVEKKSVQDFGAALTQLKQQYEKQIEDGIADLFKSCNYHCHILDKIPTGDRNNVHKIVSAVLGDRYPYVPTVNASDKMYLKSSTGSEVIGYVSKRLLENDLRPQAFPKKSYDTVVKQVFANPWGLLRLVNNQKYIVEVPSQRNIKVAWEEISAMTALGEKSEKIVEISKIWETLSRPPYGYNEYTFTILFAGWLAYHCSEVLLSGGFGIPQKKSDQVVVRTEPVKNWASTNVFDKPKDFVNIWIKNGRTSLIRRKPAPYPEVPKSVDYDQAQQFIQDINNYLSNAPDPSRVNEITNIGQKLLGAIEKINQRLTPVSQVENLLRLENNSVDIEMLLRMCTELQENLPVINEGGFTINPSPQQEKKREEVSQTVIEKIGEIIESESQRVQSLCTEADCEAYKTDINRIISQITQVTYLPIRFFEELQNALLTGNIKLSEIIEQTKFTNCLEQIKRLNNSLSSLATQSEYIDIKVQIENLVATVPATREKETYKNIVKDLEAKQEAFIQKISDWENQFSQSMPRPLAMQLSSSINQEINRFTNEKSKQRLNNLLSRVQDIILQRETEEEESEDIHDIIADAERKLQYTKNTKKLSGAFTAYRDLNQLRLPTIIKIAGLKNKPKELENLKSHAYDAISQRLTQIIEKCEQPINQDSDYEQLQSSLQQSKEFVTACDDFQRLISELQEAEETLQTQYEEFQKQQQDKQKLHSIRQYTASKANTIHLCEDSITNINSLKNDFYYPDKYISEVDKLIQEFINKVTTFKNKLHSLQERLLTVTNSKEIDSIKKEYAQLDFVFKDSTEYSIYQQLQAEIDSLAEDLDLIRHWESLYQQSNSIASCDRTLASIDDEQAKLHNLDRFRQQIEQLQTNLYQRKQGYIGQLEELYGKLSNIKTQKEAQKMQGELNNKSAYYRESQQEERYQLICSELNLVSSLLQISTTQKLDTLQACQAEKERLLTWQEESGKITAAVQTRFDSLIAQLEQIQQHITNQQRDAARKWLESLEVQNRSLESIEPVSKLDKANQLLKQIKQQKYQYQPILQAEQQKVIEKIVNNCVEFQNQDKESKIITLFQELPREQRESLLKRLPEYLSGTTEEF